MGKNSKATKPADFLMYRDPWPRAESADDELSDADLKVLRVLG